MVAKPAYPIITAEEAATMIQNGDTIALSGFGPSGSAKAFPIALADRARDSHKKGHDFKVRIITGASSGYSIDEELARAEAVSWRAPYQSGATLRKQINNQEVEYVDMHLSHLPQIVSEGFLGRIDVTVVEASEITPDGRIFLTTSIGAAPTFLQHTNKVIIEINRSQFPRFRDLADILSMPLPPYRNPIPITDPLTRIGLPYTTVDPGKILGIIETDEPDHIKAFSEPDTVSQRIAGHVTHFLLEEIQAERIPKQLLPLQAGVGNIANSVMAALGENPEIPPFQMYSEVFQDSMVDLMLDKNLLCASAASLYVTNPKLQQIIDHFDFFSRRILLRPQEISNHPGIIRRLGVIGMNTALEADIYGNINSSHLYGMDIMNGIGGSGDFARNSYLSIFMTPSIAKNGKISSIVPMCPHIDSNEHSVQVVVTEQGLADLRGLGPVQRAQKIINHCAHPAYKEYLHGYLQNARSGHIRHNLENCFELHRNLLKYGTMLP